MTTPTVGQSVPEYLPRSATFVYTLLSRLERYSPVVLARRRSHLTEFPLERVLELEGDPSRLERARRTLRARAHGYASFYERRLVEEARSHGCVLLHAHFGWSGHVSLCAARELDVPLVTTFYGRDISFRERVRKGDPYARLFAEGELFLCEGAAMAAHLGQVGCPPEKIRLVPIGIDLEEFAFSVRRRSGPLVVMQCARLVEKKGVDVTIRAYALARPRLGDSVLWIVGDGPLRSDLEKLVDECGVRSSTRFLGDVSHEDFRRLALQADICVQPSRTAADGDTEGGAPIVILEMQALGVPVVATRHADIPSVVPRPDDLVEEDDAEGVAGTLVELAELSEQELAGRATQARSFVESRHGAGVYARTVERTYDEVLA